MANGWTGGQYSLLRVLLGLAVAVELASTPGGGAWRAGLTTLGVACGTALVLGWRDRRFAILALLGGSAARVASGAPPDGGEVALAWLLIAHAMVPRAPFGSLDAVGRDDPRGEWRMPGAVYAASWIVLVLEHGYVAWTGLAGGGLSPHAAVLVAQALLLPLALARRARPWAWIGLAASHVVAPAAGSALGAVLLHAFTFDPGWIEGRDRGTVDLVFYDGSCGLCHRAVRFLAAEDRFGGFLFAPLGGATFLGEAPEPVRVQAPDTLVLRSAAGRWLLRSSAVLHAGSRLGGIWRLLAGVAAGLPVRARDAAYDAVARRRTILFAPPARSCPAPGEALRSRFLD